jgi:hypothetical protein
MHLNLLILSFITNYFSFENITLFASKISDHPKTKIFSVINKTLVFYDKIVYSNTYSMILSLLTYIPFLIDLY